MFTLKTDISKFQKNKNPGKKYKVLINAGGRSIWLYNYISNESIR